MQKVTLALLAPAVFVSLAVPGMVDPAEACGRTRDVVLELVFETVDAEGNPTTRTVRRVQGASRGHFGTRCDRRAQRLAEERACASGIESAARAIRSEPQNVGAEQLACRSLAAFEPEEARALEARGAYRLAGVALSCDLRHQSLPQLALPLEPSGKNFECEGGEVREVGPIEERCATFAGLAQTMLALSAEASCAAPEALVQETNHYDFCLAAGVDAARARLDAQKAALQQCVIDPPFAAIQGAEGDEGVEEETVVPPDDLAGTGFVDPFYQPEPAAALDGDAAGVSESEEGEALPSGDPSLVGTGAVDPFYRDPAEEGAEPGPEGELTSDDTVPLEPELPPGDPSLAGTGAVDPFYDPGTEEPVETAEVGPAEGDDEAEAGPQVASAPPPPTDACEADQARRWFAERVAGGLGCSGVTGVPDGLEGEPICGPRFSALQDQYQSRQLEQVSACIANLRL